MVLRAAAGEVIGGLKQQPVLLGIVVLNIVAIVAAVWFLHRAAEGNNERYITLLKECFSAARKG
jgi:hypothetical protein